MKNRLGITILSNSLGIDEPAAEMQFDEFSACAAAGLLEKGTLSLSGLGTFSIVHDPALKEKSEKGYLFLPPRNRLVYDSRVSGSGDAGRIAAERMGMEVRRTESFSRALAEYFSLLRQQKHELELRGLGVFSTVDGEYGFHVDASLDELLNSAYDDLKTIFVPSDQPARLLSGSQRTSGAKDLVVWRIAGLAAVAGAIAFAGFFLSGQMPPAGRFAERMSFRVPFPERTGSSLSDVSASRALRPDSLRSEGNVSVLPSPPPSSAVDSLVLQKNRFTVVAGTFSTRPAAEGERRKLAAKGGSMYLWPVSSRGKTYYRIVTGNFASHRSARDSMKAMPSGLSPDAYIQQVPKTVVLYGE